MQLKQKLRLLPNACIKKCSKISWGRWMPAKKYAMFNSSAAGCNYYTFKINSTFSIKFWNFHRMHFLVTLYVFELIYGYSIRYVISCSRRYEVLCTYIFCCEPTKYLNSFCSVSVFSYSSIWDKIFQKFF